MTKEQASKRGRHSRRKGANGEREVRDLFRAAGFLARRSIGQYRTGTDAPDVLVEGIPELWVEVKRGKRCNIKAALAQATRDCGKGQWPIAVTKEDHEKAVVTMAFDHYAALMRLAYPGAIAPVEATNGDEEAEG